MSPTPTLAEAMDQQIEALQDRMRIIRAELSKTAHQLSTQALAVVSAPTRQEAAQMFLDPYVFESIRAWQNRLDEAMLAYGVLSALRANYANEIRQAGRS